MRVRAPFISETVEFIVFAPSGGFKLRYAEAPENLEVPEDVQVIVCNLNRVPALGWSLKSPVWSAYDEQYHSWTPEQLSAPVEDAVADEFSDSLLTPPKEIKPRKKVPKVLTPELVNQNESPFPSLETHRYPGPELEKRYVQ